MAMRRWRYQGRRETAVLRSGAFVQGSSSVAVLALTSALNYWVTKVQSFSDKGHCRDKGTETLLSCLESEDAVSAKAILNLYSQILVEGRARYPWVAQLTNTKWQRCCPSCVPEEQGEHILIRQGFAVTADTRAPSGPNSVDSVLPLLSKHCKHHNGLFQSTHKGKAQFTGSILTWPLSKTSCKSPGGIPMTQDPSSGFVRCQLCPLSWSGSKLGPTCHHCHTDPQVLPTIEGRSPFQKKTQCSLPSDKFFAYLLFGRDSWVSL